VWDGGPGPCRGTGHGTWHGVDRLGLWHGVAGLGSARGQGVIGCINLGQDLLNKANYR